VSLELALTHDIPAVLIEPKPLNPNSSYRKRIKKWRKKKLEVHSLACDGSGGGVSIDGHSTEGEKLKSSAALTMQQQVQVQVQVEEFQPVSHLQEEFFGHQQQAQTSCQEQTHGQEEGEDGRGRGWSSAAVVHAVTDAGVLLAMHPDQATGAVLEAALALHKPFALVPCCVFSRQFPWRCTPEGATVTTYEQLCDWIQAQDSGIQRATLPFHGRNVVLYRV
jgi:hypothetical protein